MIRPALKLKRIYVYRHPVDMRKSIDGLAMLVEGALDDDPFSGTLFVFLNRQRDKLKILYWERNGFVVWYKRLEKERFVWPKMEGETLKLNGQQLNWLLDGYDISRLQPHQHYRYQTVL
jgi:transposase